MPLGEVWIGLLLKSDDIRPFLQMECSAHERVLRIVFNREFSHPPVRFLFHTDKTESIEWQDLVPRQRNDCFVGHFLIENFVISCNQVSELFCWRYCFASASSARSLRLRTPPSIQEDLPKSLPNLRCHSSFTFVFDFLSPNLLVRIRHLVLCLDLVMTSPVKTMCQSNLYQCWKIHLERQEVRSYPLFNILFPFLVNRGLLTADQLTWLFVFFAKLSHR